MSGSVVCMPTAQVFSYGSLIFRFDSETSISLQVMPGLVFRLQGLRVLVSRMY